MPTKASIPVHFNFLVKVSLKNRILLKRFIKNLFRQEGQALDSLQYIFCSDSFLLKINQDHLHHNYYTDIVSFDLSGDGQSVTGEIYISVDRVRDNAVNYDAALWEELHRVIFHGALHLCGYRDKSKAERAEMRTRENHYLALYRKKVPRRTVSK